LEAIPEHSSAAVCDRSLTDVVEQTGLPISVVEEALEELIRERRVKLDRSLAAHWRRTPRTQNGSPIRRRTSTVSTRRPRRGRTPAARALPRAALTLHR
jgi:hypothetical protein